MNFRKNGYIILWAVFLLSMAALMLLLPRAGRKEQNAPAAESGGTAAEAQVTPEDERELVGVWVPYMALDFEEKSEAAFRQGFEEIVVTAKEKGINAMFVHVRPFCDALYESESYPWSHIVSGTQGKSPGYDPLAVMVKAAHENNMELHAWINPLRVRFESTPAELSEENIYVKYHESYPEYFMEYAGGIYLNPAYAFVRSYIADGAAEIAAGYDVDGIHIDDYFYPSREASLDSRAYLEYRARSENSMELEQWRIWNINSLIAEMYEKIKLADSDCIFGISPQGNIENDLAMGADVRTWCAVPGYIDYICPQLYYSFENEALGFSEAMEEWIGIEKRPGLEMYAGLALYKAGSDADGGTWQNSSDIIMRQIEEARTVKCSGVVLYSIDYLDAQQTRDEVQNAISLFEN